MFEFGIDEGSATGRVTGPHLHLVVRHGNTGVDPTRPGPAGVNRGSSSPNPAPSATNLANLTGLPDLIVPAGYTSDRLPVGISFLGRMFSEARLLALGYAFEQKTRVRRDPAHTPPLPGETIPR